MAKRKQTAGERIADSLWLKGEGSDWTEKERKRLARRIDRAIKEAEKRGWNNYVEWMEKEARRGK